MSKQLISDNEKAFFQMVDNIFKKNGNDYKKLRYAIHDSFFNVMHNLIMDINSKQELINELDQRLLDSNIEQQGLLAANSAMIDKLKRNQLYANEHELTNKRIQELHNIHDNGGNVRGGELPDFLK